MGDYRLPDDVRKLLYHGVETFEQLEILMALADDAAGEWTIERTADSLGIPPTTAQDALERLARAGVLTEVTGQAPQRFAYAPSPHLVAPVDNLRRTYTEHRLTVINEITANALQRMRTTAMRAFARAFLFGDRGKRHDG